MTWLQEPSPRTVMFITVSAWSMAIYANLGSPVSSFAQYSKGIFIMLSTITHPARSSFHERINFPLGLYLPASRLAA